MKSVPKLLGSHYAELSGHIGRIQKYRNKLVHGQVTGQSIKSRQLERDVLWIMAWVSCLATEAEKEFGYDGLKRKTYRSAKATSKIAVAEFPFDSPVEFKTWLSSLT